MLCRTAMGCHILIDFRGRRQSIIVLSASLLFDYRKGEIVYGGVCTGRFSRAGGCGGLAKGQSAGRSGQRF